MVKYSRVPKGTTPPGVGGVIRKGKDKFINWKQGGDTVSKGIGEACGIIIQSKRHHPYITDAEATDAAAVGFKKRSWYPSLEGGTKEGIEKCENNSFTIFLFFEGDISATLFQHFTMWNCVYSLHHFTIIVTPYNHNDTIFLLLHHLTISPLCFTISPCELVCIICTISPY